MLQIRAANMDDYLMIKDFYYSLIDAMEDAEFKPGWEKDTYTSTLICAGLRVWFAIQLIFLLTIGLSPLIVPER